jgi:RimJ/RimL family protein N-acetyltransferase
MELTLRPVVESDLPIFFEQQCDPAGRRMVAFCKPEPGDLAAFLAKWQAILADETGLYRTIEVAGAVAGNVVHFKQMGQPSIGYWLGRHYWGRGIATRAVAAFVASIERRPLYARVVSDNVGSLRVLERCGFGVIGTERDFAPMRGEEVEEFLLELPAASAVALPKIS